MLSLMLASPVHFSILYHLFLAQRINGTPLFKAHPCPFTPISPALVPSRPNAIFYPSLSSLFNCSLPTGPLLLTYSVLIFTLYSNIFHLYLSLFTQTTQSVSLYHCLYFLFCLLLSHSTTSGLPVISYCQIQ